MEAPAHVADRPARGGKVQAAVAALVGRGWFWIVVVAIPFSWPIYLAVTGT